MQFGSFKSVFILCATSFYPLEEGRGRNEVGANDLFVCMHKIKNTSVSLSFENFENRIKCTL